jgi:hypothetical protein
VEAVQTGIAPRNGRPDLLLGDVHLSLKQIVHRHDTRSSVLLHDE